MIALFHRSIVRPMLREPVRTLLTLFAVALGVAVVLAIDLAGEAAAGSFRSSVETLAGNADLDVSALGRLEPSIVATLATLPYPLSLRSRMEDYATVVDTGEVVPFIGLDMVAGALDIDLPELKSASETPNGLWASEGFGLRTGDSIKLQFNDRVGQHRIAGVFPQRGRILVADLSVADKLLRRNGRIDRVSITLPRNNTEAIEAWEARLRAALPASVTVAPQGSKTRENARMLDAFRWNLRVLSYIALIVGAFLIYNTISVSVVRRRSEIGILRAIGASRRMILTAFLGEAVLFGLIGGLLGVALGRAMAEVTVKLVGATVEALYVSSAPAPISLALTPALVALLMGVLISVLSALPPAREAAGVAPVETMARGQREYMTRINRRRSFLLASSAALAAALFSMLPPWQGKPIGGYIAALLVIACASWIMPAVIERVSRLGSAFLRRVGVEPFLALRSLAGARRRTSVLVAALTTAIGMMVSVGIMVGSFRETVVTWMDAQLKADLYIRPAGPPSADRFPTMAPDIPDRLSQLPMVRAVDRFRAYPISYNGMPATLAGGQTEIFGESGRVRLVSGNIDDIIAKLPTCDCVIVSEPFANKHKISRGDRLSLPLGKELRDFQVLGVYFDYASERGYIILDRRVLLKYLPDPAISNAALWLKPGTDLDEAKRAVDRATAGSNIEVFANRALRTEAMRVFDRTFAITYALEAVAILVAVMGIAGALLALVIDRRRELGMLQFLGAAKKQIERLVLFEAGLLGLLANAAGFIVGAILSLILVFVINKQSFGWTIQFHWPVAVLLGALTLVFIATVAAGLYPARVAKSLNPIEVLHEE